MYKQTKVQWAFFVYSLSAGTFLKVSSEDIEERAAIQIELP